MSDMNAAPLRGQTKAAGQELSVIPRPESAVPVHPAQILAKNQPNQGASKKGKLLLFIAAGLFAAQVFAPLPLKPTVIAGGAAADFYAQIMVESQLNQERIAHQSQLAQRLATMEADYADARAKCFWGALLGPEAGDVCVQLVDANFMPAIQQIRAQLGQ